MTNLLRILIKTLKLSLFFCLIGMPLLTLLLLYFALDSTSTVSAGQELSPEHSRQAEKILKKYKPHLLRNGEQKQVEMSAEELELALNFSLKAIRGTHARVDLQDQQARVELSLPLPPANIAQKIPQNWHYFLNFDAILKAPDANSAFHLPELEKLSVGQLRLPVFLINWFWHKKLDNYGYARNTLKSLNFEKDKLRLVYQWNTDLPQQLQASLMSEQHQLSMQMYQERLAELSRQTNNGQQLSVVLHGLFSFAQQRSLALAAVENNKANLALIASNENRAALFVLAWYVNGLNLAEIFPDAKNWAKPAKRTFTLGGRPDFAQHFTVSALLAATAGSALSDVVGVYKELTDAQGGSGFSFNDIAADRSGTRFGEIAAGENAIKLQNFMSGKIQDHDLLPEVKDLPEFMQEADFIRRYGGVGAPAYQKIMQTIEHRIDALSLSKIR